jgi:predicted nucleic acid-binding protein
VRNGTVPAFVDTNVLLYSVDRRYPAQQATAQRLLSDLAISGHLVVSAQVLNEFCSAILRGKVPDSDLEPRLSGFIASQAEAATVVPLTTPLTQAGLTIAERRRMSFYDAMILAAAVEAGCDVVYAEDMQGSHTLEGVRYENPFSSA